MKQTLKSLVLHLAPFILLLMCTEPITPVPPPPVNGLDTTSHSFVWVQDTLGKYPSFLEDVFVINKDDIWATGEISGLNDTTYNAAHWDGNNWTLQRIPSRSFSGNVYPNSRMFCVFAFATDDVWMFSIVGSYAHWDGEKWKYDYISQREGSIYKIWGTSSSDLYFVGSDGAITYYNGKSFVIMDTETDVDLRDIWGSPDGNQVWASGYHDLKGSVLLKKVDNRFVKVIEITEEPDNPVPNQIKYVFKGIWTDTPDSIYIGSAGRVYAAHKDTKGYARESFWWDYDVEPGYPPGTNGLDGNSRNDLFVTGWFALLAHFNGKSWHRYKHLTGDTDFYAVSIKDNTVAAVGDNKSYPAGAVIALGNR